MKQNRAVAISFTEHEEGPYPHGWNPRDPSYCGITLPELNKMRAEKKESSATIDDLQGIQPAQIDEFYAWKCDRIGFDALASGLDYAVLDAAINEGEAGARALLTLTYPLQLDIASRIDAMSEIRLVVKKRRTSWAKNSVGWTARIGQRVPVRAKTMIGK